MPLLSINCVSPLGITSVCSPSMPDTQLGVTRDGDAFVTGFSLCTPLRVLRESIYFLLWKCGGGGDTLHGRGVVKD